MHLELSIYFYYKYFVLVHTMQIRVFQTFSLQKSSKDALKCNCFRLLILTNKKNIEQQIDIKL